jgi:hypothetical protein
MISSRQVDQLASRLTKEHSIREYMLLLGGIAKTGEVSVVTLWWSLQSVTILVRSHNHIDRSGKLGSKGCPSNNMGNFGNRGNSCKGGYRSRDKHA